MQLMKTLKKVLFCSNILEYSRIKWRSQQLFSYNFLTDRDRSLKTLPLDSSWPTASFGTTRLPWEAVGKKLSSKNIDFTEVKHP